MIDPSELEMLGTNLPSMRKAPPAILFPKTVIAAPRVDNVAVDKDVIKGGSHKYA